MLLSTGLTITGGYSEFGGGIWQRRRNGANEATVAAIMQYYEGRLAVGVSIYNLDTMTLKNQR